MLISPYRDDQFEGVRQLWDTVFPDDPPRNRAATAIPAKLQVQPELFIIAEEQGEVLGTIMAGYDGHRGWLYAVAVKPDRQGMGIGKALVKEAERRLSALGCSKVNLQVRSTNKVVVGFYRSLGYAVEERVSMGKQLSS